MKNIFKLLLLLFVGFFTSCEKELDINTDPNSPPQITPGLALAAAQASLITVVGGDFTNLGGFYAQYHTQAPSASQYRSIDEYNINTAYANRVWTELYAGCLNDLKYVIDESKSKGDNGTVLIGTLLNAYTFQLLTDVFGDVPYTEALLGVENITPKTTPGNIIYSDLLAKIDAALQAYKSNPVKTTVGAQDNIYGGNMENWIKFANTLKLKMYLRMAYTPSANPAAVNALLSDNNFITTDAKFANFGTSLNQRNPFYEVQRQFLGDVNNIASSSLLQFYNANGDSRANFVFRPNSTNVNASLPQGAGPEFSNLAANYSRPRVNPLTPVYLMTVSESHFLQAEGLIRYASGNGAKAKYEQGIIESFKTYQADFKNVDPNNAVDKGTDILSVSQAISNAQALFAVGGVYEYQNAGSVEQTVRQVIVQKWASLVYINNMESYIETTRTKFPEVVAEGAENYAIGNRIRSRISVLTGLSIPSILYYPDSEVQRNPNIKQHTSLTQKVWWDKK